MPIAAQLPTPPSIGTYGTAFPTLVEAIGTLSLYLMSDPPPEDVALVLKLVSRHVDGGNFGKQQLNQILAEKERQEENREQQEAEAIDLELDAVGKVLSSPLPKAEAARNGEAPIFVTLALYRLYITGARAVLPSQVRRELKQFGKQFEKLSNVLSRLYEKGHVKRVNIAESGALEGDAKEPSPARYEFSLTQEGIDAARDALTEKSKV